MSADGVLAPPSPSTSPAPSPSTPSALLLLSSPLTSSATSLSLASIGVNREIERGFQQCSEWEKTLTLHALLQCLTPLQMQFFASVFQHIQASTVPADQREEAQRKANDPGFLRTSLQLAEKSPVADALLFLTKTLALLRADNTVVAAQVLAFVVDMPTKEQYAVLNESAQTSLKQVLSMIIAHPAFNEKQRNYVREQLFTMMKREGDKVAAAAAHVPEMALTPATPSSSSDGLTDTVPSGASSLANIILAPKPFRRASGEERAAAILASHANFGPVTSTAAPVGSLAHPVGMSAPSVAPLRDHPLPGSHAAGETGTAQHSDIYLPPFKQTGSKSGLSKSRSVEFARSERYHDQPLHAGVSHLPTFSNNSNYLLGLNNNHHNSSPSSNNAVGHNHSSGTPSPIRARDAFQAHNPPTHHQQSHSANSSPFNSQKEMPRVLSSNALASQDRSSYAQQTSIAPPPSHALSPHNARGMPTLKHAASMSTLPHLDRVTVQSQYQSLKQTAAAADSSFVNDLMNVPEGINSIALWLRSLRLHKYTDQLQHFDMVTMSMFTDDDFQKHGVSALGARRKLIQAIKSVMALQAKVAPLAKEINQPGRFLDSVSVLREVLATYKGQLLSCGMYLEFTKQYTAVLFKGFCHLSVNQPDRENHLAFIKLLKLAISSRSFPKRDQTTYAEWRDELEQLAYRFGFMEPHDDHGGRGRHAQHGYDGGSHSNGLGMNSLHRNFGSTPMGLNQLAGNGTGMGRPLGMTSSMSMSTTNVAGFKIGGDEDDEESDVNLLLARQRRQRRSRANRSKSESSASAPLDVPLGPLTDAEKQEMERQILEEMRNELKQLNADRRSSLDSSLATAAASVAAAVADATSPPMSPPQPAQPPPKSVPSANLASRMRPRASRSMPIDGKDAVPTSQTLLRDSGHSRGSSLANADDHDADDDGSHPSAYDDPEYA